MSDRRGDWIITYTGKRFYPLDPRPEDVDIIDIAHSLSMTCRFVGHVREFYSVAQHSVLVASQAPRGHELLFLLHDAAEAYIGDISRPLKKSLWVWDQDRPADKQDDSETVYAMEARIQVCIYTALGVAPYTQTSLDALKAADNLLIATEVRDLMSQPVDPDARKWYHDLQGSPTLRGKILPWCPVDAKTEFLRLYDNVRAR